MDTLLTELRNNPRLRIGLWLIVATLLLYTSLILNDYQTELQNDYTTAAERLEQLTLISQQAQWQTRVKEIRDLRLQLEQKLWTANTLGLAQANLQAWLNEKTKLIQLNDIRIRVDTPQEDKRMKLWQVNAQLEGKFTPTQLEQLLTTLATHPQYLIIERLDIRQLPNNIPQFNLALTAWFQAVAVNTP